jgi:hypothetical protein
MGVIDHLSLAACGTAEDGRVDADDPLAAAEMRQWDGNLNSKSVSEVGSLGMT